MKYISIIVLFLFGCKQISSSIDESKKIDLVNDAGQEICWLPEDINEKDKERINVCWRGENPFIFKEGSIPKENVCSAIKDGFLLFHICATKLVNLGTKEVILSYPSHVESNIEKGFIPDKRQIYHNKYGVEYSKLLSECVKDKCCLDEEKSKYGYQRQYYTNDNGECVIRLTLEEPSKMSEAIRTLEAIRKSVEEMKK